MRVIIAGGGAIGAATAHRLAARGAEVTLVERTGVACAASGKSGGFLALDWCDGGPLEALARRSFALHAELAASPEGGWGYRRLDAYAGTLGPGAGRVRHGSRLGWTAPELRLRGRLGTAETTAQVDPAAFTRAMMRAALRRGAVLHAGEVTGLFTRGGRVAGVEVGGRELEADAVVIAMGPWSRLASRWLDLPPVSALKGHSAVFATGQDVPAEALFLEVEDAAGAVLTPEVFPRADGTTYVCAISTQPPLPLDPADVAPDDGAVGHLLDLCERISPALDRSRLVRTGACFRPMARDGLPLIGAVPGAPGAYVATGHGVWGILNAPATAEALAELVLDGAARRVDLRPFDPRRLPGARPVPVGRALPRAVASAG